MIFKFTTIFFTEETVQRDMCIDHLKAPQKNYSQEYQK